MANFELERAQYLDACIRMTTLLHHAPGDGEFCRNGSGSGRKKRGDVFGVWEGMAGCVDFGVSVDCFFIREDFSWTPTITWGRIVRSHFWAESTSIG